MIGQFEELQPIKSWKVPTYDQLEVFSFSSLSWVGRLGVKKKKKQDYKTQDWNVWHTIVVMEHQKGQHNITEENVMSLRKSR